MTATLERPATDSAPRDAVRRVWITGSVEAYKEPVLVDVHTVGEEVPGCVRVFCDYDSIARKNFRYIDAPLDPQPGAVELDYNQLCTTDRIHDGVAAFTRQGDAVKDLAARALLWAENDCRVAIERLELARALADAHLAVPILQGVEDAHSPVNTALAEIDCTLKALGSARWPDGVTL